MARAAEPQPVVVQVWDAPIRLFHWGVVLLVATSYVCARAGWMRLHFLSGYTIIAALLFRLAWGLIGSETAQFGRFLRNPLATVAHLRQLPHWEPDLELGHNAAGGWMVVLTLVLLACQAGTGLFANDDVISDGPLYDYVGKAVSDRITSLHLRNFNLLLAAIAVHVIAIAAYRVLKGENLFVPMLTGRKLVPAGQSRHVWAAGGSPPSCSCARAGLSPSFSTMSDC
jgi:cytochrome b